MGSVSKVISSAVNAITLGSVDLSKKKQPKVVADTEDLQEEAERTSKQRKALFATEGDILGEEVEGVGKKKRGTILGN